MKKSEAVNELFTALAKAQALFRGAIADTSNEYFNSNYANLSSVWEAIRGPLSENGLSVIQTTSINEAGLMFLHSVLAHASGQWMSSDYPIMPPKQNDAQALGATITYARRYALSALVGIAQVDDDGEGLQGRKAAAKKVSAKASDLNQITAPKKPAPIVKPSAAVGQKMAVPLVKPKSVFPTT